MNIQNLTLDEEKTNLLIDCIEMARQKGKEILLINLFKTELKSDKNLKLVNR